MIAGNATTQSCRDGRLAAISVPAIHTWARSHPPVTSGWATAYQMPKGRSAIGMRVRMLGVMRTDPNVHVLPSRLGMMFGKLGLAPSSSATSQ